MAGLRVVEGLTVVEVRNTNVADARPPEGFGDKDLLNQRIIGVPASSGRAREIALENVVAGGTVLGADVAVFGTQHGQMGGHDYGAGRGRHYAFFVKYYGEK
ncbi:hypothetical protein HYY70_03470 [Candidatus Woesearchaeota archaeon]|nr:hypothetical protein [Candidatus Woesearchaeota archaeon]